MVPRNSSSSGGLDYYTAVREYSTLKKSVSEFSSVSSSGWPLKGSSLITSISGNKSAIALIIVDFPVPLSPIIITPPTLGSITFNSKTSFRSSSPTIAVKGNIGVLTRLCLRQKQPNGVLHLRPGIYTLLVPLLCRLSSAAARDSAYELRINQRGSVLSIVPAAAIVPVLLVGAYRPCRGTITLYTPCIFCDSYMGVCPIVSSFVSRKTSSHICSIFVCSLSISLPGI